MSLLTSSLMSSPSPVFFNTDTMFDLMTGKYQQSDDGEWYLNGGLRAHTNLIAGPQGHYKTVTSGSLVMRAKSIYADSDLIVNDTEESSIITDKDRFLRMAGDRTVPTTPENIIYLSGAEFTMDKFYKEILLEICKKKEENKKDLQVETPFIDERTGKRLKVWTPTFVLIDSLSNLGCEAYEELIAGGMNESKAQTGYMLEGNKKTLFTKTLLTMAVRYGLVIVMTAHYDEKIQVQMYSSSLKQTMYAKQNWTLKHCGSDAKFSVSNYATVQAAFLEDQNHEAMYKRTGSSLSKECAEVKVTLERSKGNSSGVTVPFVCSQIDGLLNPLSSYHYLRENNYFGLGGNKITQKVMGLPDVSVSRNTIRDIMAKDYRVCRALQLTAQYFFIKSSWFTANMPWDFDKNPYELMDKFMSDKNKNVVSDILESRGYWTYSPVDRPYMSLFKVLELIGAKK